MEAMAQISQVRIGSRVSSGTILSIFALSWSVVFAQGHDMMQPRVPSDRLEEARGLTSPLPDSPETIEKGKALYHGKGTCFSCHGQEGRGDGPVASQLTPSPRNFQHHGFWRHRTEGEIFWVIKHGSPGTSMIGFAGQLTDEEIWAIIHYERTFSLHQRRGMRGMGGRGPMGHMGSSEDMGGERMGQTDREEAAGSRQEEMANPNPPVPR